MNLLCILTFGHDLLVHIDSDLTLEKACSEPYKTSIAPSMSTNSDIEILCFHLFQSTSVKFYKLVQLILVIIVDFLVNHNVGMWFIFSINEKARDLTLN